MRLEKFYVENFRAFKNRIYVNLDSLTTLIGKNDIGKSSLLEAMDIFFNDKDSTVKLDSNDYNITSENKTIILGAMFSDLPKSLIIDAQHPTTLANEYLLNCEHLLEIQKIYESGKLKEVKIIANHPENEELKNIFELKISELKKKAEDLNIDKNLYTATISSSIRKAIFNHFSESLSFNPQMEIIVQKEKDTTKSAVKDIWKQLDEYIPLYALFQSDRKNEEKDKEIQNPINFAIRAILKDSVLNSKLNEIKEIVQKTSEEFTDLTIKKIKEMNPEIAKELNPSFSEPKWDSIFKFSLFDEESIPIDKRGSGVKRIILLNFFRADAEKRQQERNVPHVIYAIEEPETSQHPDHQKMLIDAFIDLANCQNTQILLTTHSPGIAKLVPEKSLKYITKENGIIAIKSDEDIVLTEIAATLGVLPDIEIYNTNKVKLAVCLEGKNDIEFLINVNKAIPEFKSIIDLENEEKVILLPMGGSALQYWVNKDYLSRLNISQLHIYDSDIGSSRPNKYTKYVNEIKSKNGNNSAFETKKREFENYIHPTLIKQEYGYDFSKVENYDHKDIPELIAISNLSQSNSEKKWDEIDSDDQKERKRKIKNQFNVKLSRLITLEQLKDNKGYEEFEEWFSLMAKFIL